MNAIHAPWSTEQVAALWKWQCLSGVHPFTCGNEHDREVVLVPTTEGWVCPEDCDYTQTWAHAFMADPTFAAEVTRQVDLIFGGRS